LFTELWLASYLLNEYEAIIDKYIIKFEYKKGISKLIKIIFYQIKNINYILEMWVMKV